MHTGQIARRVDGRPFTDGALTYFDAVVAQTEPTVLVSRCGTSRWSETVSGMRLICEGEATRDQLAVARARLRA